MEKKGKLHDPYLRNKEVSKEIACIVRKLKSTATIFQTYRYTGTYFGSTYHNAGISTSSRVE